MKLPRNFRIEITGDTATVLGSARSDSTLGYLLARMLAGMTIDESELDSWGLSVKVCDPDDEFIAIPRMD